MCTSPQVRMTACRNAGPGLMAALETCAQGALPPAANSSRPKQEQVQQQPVAVPAAAGHKPAAPPVFRCGPCFACRLAHATMLHLHHAIGRCPCIAGDEH